MVAGLGWGAEGQGTPFKELCVGMAAVGMLSPMLGW